MPTIRSLLFAGAASLSLWTSSADAMTANFCGVGSCAFNYSGTIQTYTAPLNARYVIEAWGAQGGGYNFDPRYAGGRGAMVRGRIYLNAGDTLSILVGGAGSGGGDIGFGGGGASWVFRDHVGDLLIAAGGGGGAGYYVGPGGPGQKTQTGQNGRFGGAGGTGGFGGAGGPASDGGGGGGWFGPGGTGGPSGYPIGTGGIGWPSFQGGFTVGCEPDGQLCFDEQNGGFGGGGGAGYDGGGGGGGYSGGGAGYGGGGGGSYLSADFLGGFASRGARFGNGLVFIAIPIPEPSGWTLILIGFGALGATLRSRRALATSPV